jgi:DNA-binding response OmpR family regulator
MRSQGNHTPVILVTALSALDDKVEGLDAGADDYLAKPFEIKELLARIRALSRRPTKWESQDLITYGDTSLDLSCCILQGPARSCSLSKREASLAEVFLKNPLKILPRNVILSKVWGPDAPVEDGNLDNYIHFIRRRLHTIGSTLQIKTIRAIGYCLEAAYAE